MTLSLVVRLVLTADPKTYTLTGLDKPKKEQRGTLENSEFAQRKVTRHGLDEGGRAIRSGAAASLISPSARPRPLLFALHPYRPT